MISSTGDLYIGIDCGTSGIRAIAIDGKKNVVAQSRTAMGGSASDIRVPETWKVAFETTLNALVDQLDRDRVRAIAVDGTSGTLIAVDGQGTPIGNALMYNDSVDDTRILDAIHDVAPVTSGVHGANSGLARFLKLQSQHQKPESSNVTKIIHQADWLSGLLSARFDLSDENNALKTGYDPIERRWPDWITDTGVSRSLLPDVVAPGTVGSNISSTASARFHLPDSIKIVTGTTDGCASFLATGARDVGDAVTALGTTLTVKLLADNPLFAPEYGLYSHRLGDRWLAGGASNSGGNVLLHYFNADTIKKLSDTIDPTAESRFNYYPLTKPGERFPYNDPEFAPRVSPRPPDDSEFLKALFAGIADIEALGYQRLRELGGPMIKSIRSVGGGSHNATWSEIRSRKLGVPFKTVLSDEAAMGTAILALEAVT